jgi:molybdopterin adenylyltransferase
VERGTLEGRGLRIGILTVSDACARGERRDRSGEAIAEWCEGSGWRIAASKIVPDERSLVTRSLLEWVDGATLDVILTTGGTGFSPRDVTPEATRPVLDREAPGLAEEIRRRGTSSTPYAVISRGLAGTRGSVLIVNLPGSPGGVRDGLEVLTPILPHVCALLQGSSPSHEPPGPEA